jgi:hypothetical protein
LLCLVFSPSDEEEKQVPEQEGETPEEEPKAE